MRKRIIGIALIVAVSISALLTSQMVFSTGDVVASPGNAQAGTSVVWLVLDEAPLYALLSSEGKINAQRFPGFAMLAESSTWFRNTLGTAQRTTEAVPALLTGVWPTLRNYPVLRDHPINLFTLTQDSYKLDVYQSITNLCPANACPNKIPDEQRQSEFQIQAFKDLTTSASTSTQKTIHFSHILLPHRPWRLSTDMRIARELRTDPRRNTVIDRRRDAYQALLRQFVATDTLLLDFLTQLKASNNWNRTMLVVTADHGLTFVPGESYRDKVNPLNPGTLEDIYRVPLFIKFPQQAEARVSDCPVSSIDILPTVLGTAEIEIPQSVDGFNLSKGCPERTSRRVQWPYTGADLTTSFQDVLDRVRYYNSWVSADGDSDDIHRVGLSGTLIGTKVPVSPEIDANISWKNIDNASFTGIGDGALEYVPARVSGRVTTNRAICDQCEGVLVVDGVVVASIPELAGLRPASSTAYFTTSLLTSAVTSTSSEPELWIADWSNPTPVLTRTGASKDR